MLRIIQQHHGICKLLLLIDMLLAELDMSPQIFCQIRHPVYASSAQRAIPNPRPSPRARCWISCGSRQHLLILGSMGPWVCWCRFSVIVNTCNYFARMHTMML